MRQASLYSALIATMLVAGAARAQVAPGTVVPGAAPGVATAAGVGGVRIVFPQEGQDVRGEITIQYEGVPDGGYAMVKVDNLFKQATADPTFVLNTFPPTFAGDGPHSLSVTAINAAGKRVGEAHVTFNVANNVVATDQPSVHLVHWIPQDRLGMPVQRYRIFAESNAIIEEPAGGAGGAGGGGGGASSSGGGGEGGGDFLPAPLDWEISALVRRVVRDVGMVDESANIRSVVQEALQRQRYGAATTGGGESGASGGASGSSGASSGGHSGGSGGGSSGSPRGGASGGASGGENAAPAQTRPGCIAVTLPPNPLAKAPWNLDSCGAWWDPAPELGQYFVKMILPSGEEINATRKASNVGLADLFPIFPPGDVKPGSSWTTTMTFISELSTRAPINLRDVPIVFTTFEKFTTPAGEERRAAKLESQRFRLPPSEATKIAQRLEANAGTAGGGEGGGQSGSGSSGGRSSGGAKPAGGGAAGGAGGTEPLVQNARTVMTRVLWFDVENHRVLRSEDTVDTYYESQAAAGGEGGQSGSSSPRGGAAAFGPPGSSGGGGAQAPAEPKKVYYNMRISTWLDDRIPNPTDVWSGGRGTVHDPTPVGRRDTTPVRDPVLTSTLQPGAPTSISDRAAASLR